MTVDYEDLDIKDVVNFIRNNFFGVLVGGVLGLVLSVGAFFLLEKKYETYSVVIPENLEQKILMQVGGTGFNLGGGFLSSLGLGDMDSNTVSVISVLESRELIYKIIKEKKLLPQLFESRWDKDKKEWILDDDEVPPSLWHGHKKFLEDYYSVRYENQEGIIIISIEWNDPEQAAIILQEIISHANNILKNNEVIKVKNNILYLHSYIEKEQQHEMRQLIFETLIQEEKKLMLYLNNSIQHLEVIVPSVAPPLDQFIFPNLLFLVFFGVSLGSVVGIIVTSIVRSRLQKQQSIP